MLLLTKIRDASQDFEILKTTCVDLASVMDFYPSDDQPKLFVDEDCETDEYTQELLDKYTDIHGNETKAVVAEKDGNCLFNAMSVLYPNLTEAQLRVRTIIELCNNEQHYNTLMVQMGLNLVDDESVQTHVLRISNEEEYTAVLTVAALSTVSEHPIESIYPNVNFDDHYWQLLNTTFKPRVYKHSSADEPLLRILWSGPEPEPGQERQANHFVPLIYMKRDAEQPQTASSTEVPSVDENRAVKSMDNRLSFSTVSRCRKMLEEREKSKENQALRQREEPLEAFKSKNIFLDATDILSRSLDGKGEMTVRHSSNFFTRYSNLDLF